MYKAAAFLGSGLRSIYGGIHFNEVLSSPVTRMQCPDLPVHNNIVMPTVGLAGRGYPMLLSGLQAWLFSSQKALASTKCIGAQVSAERFGWI